ncbi:MAG: hypothetical protein AAFR47_24675, partial [Pseudomonadota bacterium]
VRIGHAHRSALDRGSRIDGRRVVIGEAAYSYLFALENPEVELRSGPFAGSIVEYDGGAHIFSIGGSIRF